MSCDRAPRDQFSSDKDLGNRRTRQNIDIILANRKFLALVDRRGTKLAKILEIDRALKAGEEIAPWQRSVVEEAYESTMKGYGLEAADTHKDKRRKGLRYGT